MAATEKQHQMAEEAVEKLSFALDIPERKVVELLQDGLNLNAPNCKLSDHDKEIIEELEATFCL